MRLLRGVIVVSGAAAVWCAAPLAVANAVILTANAEVLSVSCTSPGNCVAGGYFQDRAGYQAFVVTERNGTWDQAREVPGSGRLNSGGSAAVNSVSCPSAGNCAAVGYFADRSSFDFQGFVVAERNGTWDRAQLVPGLGRLNAGSGEEGGAEVLSVSCASTGNCSAGGYYLDRSEKQQGFVVTERNGTWGRALEVPGLGKLNTGSRRFAADAQVVSVSCGSAGNCSAGGFYVGLHSGESAFVVTERHDTWSRALEVPGLGKLNTAGIAAMSSVSCSSAGNCSAGGSYTARNAVQAFVVSERHGTWGQAEQVPGSGKLNVGGFASVNSVSCARAGDCTAGGFYDTGPPNSNNGVVQAFVVSEQNGRWGRILEVPGSGKLNTGGDAAVNSVSCPSAGNCSAGGYYGGPFNTSGVPTLQALVAGERNGAWGRAEQVPGSGALNTGAEAQVLSVSCTSPGNCSAGGYLTTSFSGRAFVVDERNGAWGQAQEVPGLLP